MVWKVGMKILLCLFVCILVISISPWSQKSKNSIPGHTTPPPVKGVDVPVTSEKKSLVLEDIEFPKNFFFGTASSDFQTTGGNGLTDWNLYVKNFKLPLVGPGKGTDFLNRYKEDFDLAGSFNDEVHRISLEWARVEPEEGRFNSEAIRKYKEILSYAKQKGIDPMICLNHFALPLWMVEKGGLESSEFPFYYSRYAETVARRIGLPLKIKWWLTFNEPQIMLQPYIKGIWPPDKPVKSFQDSEGSQRVLKVASHLIDAHRLSYRAIHQTIKGTDTMVSFASAPGSFYPNDPDSPLDQMAYNFFNMINTLLSDYSAGKTDRDFIGLNYYGRVKLKLHISWWENVLPWLTEKKPFAVEWKMPTQGKQGLRPKEFYPQGLYDLIMKFKDLNLPIVITENGLNDSNDQFREEFIVIHLKAIHDAISDGADVIGYQYWALTDTWEWDGAFSQMGLISIDRTDNFTRKLRQSAITYREIIQSKKISKELLEKHRELLK